jgi:hypothetical protein
MDIRRAEGLSGPVGLTSGRPIPPQVHSPNLDLSDVLARTPLQPPSVASLPPLESALARASTLEKKYIPPGIILLRRTLVDAWRRDPTAAKFEIMKRGDATSLLPMANSMVGELKEELAAVDDSHSLEIVKT